MNKEKLIAFLQFKNHVSEIVRREIAEQFDEKEISRHAFHLGEGEICDEYFFLEQGLMRAFAFDTEGNDVTTNFYLPGQMIFEVSSFFNRTRSKESIQALTDCAGWYITYDQLNHLFHTIPEFREFGRATLVKGFTEQKNRMLSMITETAEERYSRLLKDSAEILQQAPLKTIATYLGVTDTSLSRIRKSMSHK